VIRVNSEEDMPQEFTATFVRKHLRTDKVASFVFHPARAVPYLAGQFAQVVFDEKELGNKALNKYLSFSCRPGKAEFEVTKKLSESDFSKRLLALKSGDRVLFKGPMGNCVLTPEMKKVGFLIGGIGITPVISILEDIVDKRLTTDISLLYSNWTVKDIAYKPQLDTWSRDNKNIRVTHTVVECGPNDKSCFSGMITSVFVQQQMPDYKERQIFIYGPPGMVKAMQELCQGLGCAPDKIKAENFVGY
jgi:glycine betaine catabolism B